MNITDSPALYLLIALSLALFFILSAQLIELLSPHKIFQGRPFSTNWQRTLNTIITMAPLAGLLGTVSGLRLAFSALDNNEAGLAAGLAEVLITTKMGLLLSLLGMGLGAALNKLYQRHS